MRAQWPRAHTVFIHLCLCVRYTRKLARNGATAWLVTRCAPNTPAGKKRKAEGRREESRDIPLRIQERPRDSASWLSTNASRYNRPRGRFLRSLRAELYQSAWEKTLSGRETRGLFPHANINARMVQ